MRRFDIIREASDAMLDLGWEPYQNDHEDANGQFEMNWKYDDVLVTADKYSFFKFMIKSLAEKHGFRATFMPKPFPDLTGNGCHAHISAWDLSGKTNVFADDSSPDGLSQKGMHFLGGIMKYAAVMTAIICPTVNSYKRINAPRTMSGATWAPNTVTWTGNNRTHMVRVPGPGRFELRLPDGAANPYLMQAVIWQPALKGFATRSNPVRAATSTCTPKGHTVKDAPRLPLNLLDALRHFDKDKEFKAALGRRSRERLRQAEDRGMEFLRLALHAVGTRPHAGLLNQSSRNRNSRPRRGNEVMKYSIFSLARAALSGHRNWARTWRDASPEEPL